MFGIANYVFIIVGLFLIVGSLWDYKVFNPLIWGDTRNKKGVFKNISPVLFKINNIKDYWDGLLGVLLCLVGLYGIVNNIHETDDIELSDMMQEIFHKNKDNKEESDEY
tara:strand:+ start:395 stop:721 length:327 start_codon:yes stop_codon:yes gene_type:complete